LGRNDDDDNDDHDYDDYDNDDWGQGGSVRVEVFDVLLPEVGFELVIPKLGLFRKRDEVL